MGDAVVISAAQWLGKMVMEELKYLGAVTNKVEQLNTELNTLGAFLMEAVKTRGQDHAVRTTLSDARVLAYDCEDVIETYVLEIARLGYEDYAGEFCRFGSIIRWFCLLRKPMTVRQIRSSIDDLNARASSLKSSLLAFGISGRIDNNNNNNNTIDALRRVFTHEREEYRVVGRDNQLNELVLRLLDMTDQRVIAICGMGGVGKSTLAAELYHNPTLRADGNFQAFGWAVASQQCQPDRVMRTLMYSLVPENDLERRRKIDQDIAADRGHAALYDLMKKVKSVVIVDDIWTSEDWIKLQAAFPRRNATGSRIVLTTRNQDILTSVLEPEQIYLSQVKGLDAANSWELFQITTFPGATSIDPTKKELGREMLRHCQGVPLAIVVLGKVLKRKKKVEEWKSMRDDIFAQIQRGGGALRPYKEVYDVLQVSYDELPFHLKHCFLHLANYPEDFEIQTEKLYQLWAAEGIIVRQDPDELEEDIAENYLKELVSRNMVEVASWDEGTESIRSCRLHDLMRDVCIDIAKKEGFLQPINCQRSMVLTALDKNVNHHFKSYLPKRDKSLRRLVVYVSDHKKKTNGDGDENEDQEEEQSSTILTPPPTDVSRAPNLRTLLIFTTNEQRCQEGGEGNCKRLVETIVQDHPLLRVFDCEEFPIRGKLPKKTGELIHLRYLGLASTYISELPSSIEKLRLLQTLDLRVNENVVVSLPNIIWKMKQLRHLYLPWYGGLGLAEKDRMKDSPHRYLVKGGGGLLRLDGPWNLQTIIYLDLDRLNPNGLSKLRRLKTLTATCETNKMALYPFLNSTNVKYFALRLHRQIINEDPMILSRCDVMHDLHLHGEPYSYLGLKKPLCLDMLPKSLVSLGIWYIRLVMIRCRFWSSCPSLFI